jgi:hypothetical protein
MFYILVKWRMMAALGDENLSLQAFAMDLQRIFSQNKTENDGAALTRRIISMGASAPKPPPWQDYKVYFFYLCRFGGEKCFAFSAANLTFFHIQPSRTETAPGGRASLALIPASPGSRRRRRRAGRGFGSAGLSFHGTARSFLSHVYSNRTAYVTELYIPVCFM